MSEHFFSLAGVVADIGEAAKTHSPATLQSAPETIPLNLQNAAGTLSLTARHTNTEGGAA